MMRLPLKNSVRVDVLTRDNYRCQYCGRTSIDSVLHVDHKISFSDGGTDDLENLQTLCSSCNYGKSTRLPGESKQGRAKRKKAFIIIMNDLFGIHGNTNRLIKNRFIIWFPHPYGGQCGVFHPPCYDCEYEKLVKKAVATNGPIETMQYYRTAKRKLLKRNKNSSVNYHSLKKLMAIFKEEV